MLSASQFDEHFKKLLNFHGRKFSAEQLLEWYEIFKQNDEYSFSKGIEDCKLEHRGFPVPSDLEGFITRARMRKSLKHRQFHDSMTPKKLVKQSGRKSEYFHDATAVFAYASSPSHDSENLADMMFDMEKKYPGIGWGIQAKRVLHDWSKRNGLSTPDCLMPREEDAHA